MQLRKLGKLILTGLAVALTWPSCAICNIERRWSAKSESCFLFWAHVYSLLPGRLGSIVRRAFFYQTLQSCSLDCEIGFGSIFTHRMARVECGVYIGDLARIGCATLRSGTLVGSRVSLLSGGSQHMLDQDGHWTATDVASLSSIVVGPDCWLGEGAVVMADVGAGSMVAAGAVVGSAVCDHVMVAGNPARFVRKLDQREDSPLQNASQCNDDIVIGSSIQ